MYLHFGCLVFLPIQSFLKVPKLLVLQAVPRQFCITLQGKHFALDFSRCS